MSRIPMALTLVAATIAGIWLGAVEGRRAGAAEAAAPTALSTHVLDASSGRPAAGVPVRLERAGEVLGQGKTDKDGRLELGPAQLGPGTYRMIFNIDSYNPQSFYPEITLTFRISEPGPHLHLPILLSPFAFTTYRGS
jgi:5-hydroxyisourate hydrolase